MYVNYITAILLFVGVNFAYAEVFEKQVEYQLQNYIEKGEFLQVKDQVNVYQTPDGWGFQTINFYDSHVEYVGYGQDAKEYTYIVDTIVYVASSTDDVGGIDFRL